MKKNPDYENFCKHIEEWEKNNIAYTLKDMVELADKFNCPVPTEVRDKCHQ